MIVKRLFSILAGLFLTLSIIQTAEAQFSPDAFEMQKHSDLYDERGFQQSKAISVDGSLIVTEANGNVSYRYPISSHPVSGYPVTVSLNYCGSVAFTTFKDYYRGPLDPGDPEPEGEWSVQGGGQRWGKFHQNRPAWILGVNGFAIQVLGTTTQYHMDHSALTDPDFEERTTFDDDDFVWCADGFDFSNRMKNLGVEENIGGIDKHEFVDAIRLLREDGSVLTLINAKRSDTITYQVWSDSMYTGYYVPHESNNNGFAYVDYAPGGMPAFVDGFESNYTNPRRVRYYPGNGLEYVFYEYVIPYGTDEYRETLQTYGGAKAGPTIFYLEEINSNGGRITKFSRSRHDNRTDALDQWQGYDSTKGRALITQFDGHTINYSNSGLYIEAAGRTIVVRCDTITKSGNTGSETEMPLAINGYRGPTSESIARMDRGNADQYKSYLGYVTEIIDPEGRVTRFDYERYWKKYVGPGFPVASSTATVTLGNYRLTEIQEPTARYELEYYDSDPNVTGPPVGDTVEIEPTTTDQYAIQNIVKKTEKYQGATLLTSDEYLFNYNGGDPAFINKATHTTTDEITNTSTTTTLHFRKHKLPRFLPFMPDPRHTEMFKTVRVAEGDTVIRESTEDSLAPYMRLTSTTTETVNSLSKSTVKMTYDLERICHFSGDSALAQYFGNGIAWKRETYTCPCLECDSLDSAAITYKQVEETYLNLPLIDTTYTVIDSSRLNKFKTYEKYQELIANGTISGSWEENIYNPLVFVGDHDTITQKVPPYYGLVKIKAIADLQQEINTAKVNIYETTFSPTFGALPRGTLLRDSITGGILNGSQSGIRGSTYTYVRSRGHWLADSLINANGAVSRNFYKSTYASSTLHHNDAVSEPYRLSGSILDFGNNVRGRELFNREYFSFLYEKPSVTRQFVRRVNPSTFGITQNTLDQYQELTYHGLASAVVDPNGWLSEFDYDYNGRLNTARLPYDFPILDTFHTETFSGTVGLPGNGLSIIKWAYDTVYCNNDCDVIGYALAAPVVWRYEPRILFAENPTLSAPDCYGNYAMTQKKGGPSPQRTCNSPLPYTRREPTIGELLFDLAPADTFSIVSIDSTHIRLYVASISDTCVHVEFTKPEWGLSKTLVFNCPVGSGGSQTFVDEQERQYFRLDMTDWRDSILALAGSATPALKLTFEVTTSGGSVSFATGMNAEDTRTRLMLKGSFQHDVRLVDYTLRYDYDDDALTSVVRAKVDDSLHSSNVLDWPTIGSNRRETKSQFSFGADYRVQTGRVWIGKPSSPVRIDSVTNDHTGTGAKRKTTDEKGDTTVTAYDALGRPTEVINADGTTSGVSYSYGTAQGLGLTDQEFPCDFVAVTVTRREDSVLFVKYTDAFGRVRREVADSGGLHLITRYEFDYLDRLRLVINPKGDTTRYWYDRFGRIRYKFQPDIDTLSYAYDNLGNVRFTQSQQQANTHRMTFNEYDDLNRLVLVGEMIHIDGAETDTTIHYGIAPPGRDGDEIDRSDQSFPGSAAKRGPTILSGGSDTLNLNRYTDVADPKKLNTGLTWPYLTANQTLWMTTPYAVPTMRPDTSVKILGCQIGPSGLLSDTTTAYPPLLMSPVWPSHFYDPRKGPGASLTDFEHLALYPHFPRMAICYDSLPARKGSIWKNFPPYYKWDSIAPRGKIRNMKGKEVAIAYRDHGGEPYHYVVLSYDERGRVEALLRYTESLGFDAVYYSYNSANMVTTVRVADPFRQYTSFYGYDWNGRVDSIWTKLQTPFSGLLVNLAPSMRADSLKRPTMPSRPEQADITYIYTKTGQIDTMTYPPSNITVTYAYNSRKWLTTIRAGFPPPFTVLFWEDLTYDATGQITRQSRRNYSNLTWFHQDYGYDAVQRLTWWKTTTAADTTFYTYDDVGNRQMSGKTGATWDDYSYYGMSQGPNRLNFVMHHVPATPNQQTYYQYNANGSTTDRTRWNLAPPTPTIISQDHFFYSYRELTWRYVNGRPNVNSHYDWRYRYNAMGEREQKRMYHGPQNDAQSGMAYPWTYYLLGGKKEQLSVWQGQQRSAPTCSQTGRNVFMYPTEYLTHGVGGTANIVTRPDGVKLYKVFDHLGSTRATYSVAAGTRVFDLSPFGEQLGGTIEPRKGFIDKERDKESGTMNIGVRQYTSSIGRFNAIDAKLDQYPSLSPYCYAANNPIPWRDVNGQEIDFNGDAGLEKGFLDALDHLEKCGAKEASMLRFLYESKDFTLLMRNSGEVLCAAEFTDDDYLADMPAIYWCPTQGFKYEVNVDGTTIEQRQSPAIILVDECSHAYKYFTNNKAWEEGRTKVDAQYQTVNERESIEKSFNAAQQCGEVQYIRPNHETGACFVAKEVTSNEPKK